MPRRRFDLERSEARHLVPYAQTCVDSRGREHPEDQHPFRTAFQRDRLGEILVEAECARERPRDAGNLNRVRHPRAIMITRAVEEDLRLVFEAAEGAAVDDAVAVTLEGGAERMLVLRVLAAPRSHARLRIERKMARLTPLQIKTASRHCTKLSPNGAGFN